MKLMSAEKISLKNNPSVNEDMIQKFIFDNPSVLGLGDLSPIRREKVQPSGGRLDLLLGDDETHYEVEVMLGATDPSHIIRTIEYWDSERKRYPQIDHCAVIVAEEITGRFMNVISLFNGAIPLIALQMSATKVGEDINLDFVRVIDRIIPGTDEENESEVVTRSFWEKKTDMLSIIEAIASDVKEYYPVGALIYRKSRIVFNEEGAFFNFLIFYPRQKNVKVHIKCSENPEFDEELNSRELDFEYSSKKRRYSIRLTNIHEFEENKEIFRKMIKNALELKNIEV